jgi:DNA-binding LytR/AlgR family response regulator
MEMKQDIKEISKATSASGQSLSGFKRTENEAYCLLCEREVELKTFEQAAEILKTNFREILDLAEAGQVHRLHNSRGRVVICSESLSEILEKRPTQRFNLDFFKTNPSSSNIFMGEIS